MTRRWFKPVVTHRITGAPLFGYGLAGQGRCLYRVAQSLRIGLVDATDQQAKERMKDGGKKGGQCKGKENLPYPSAEQQARDAAGKAVKAETARIRATWSERTHRVRAGLQRASDPPPRYEFPMVDARLLGER